MVLSPPSQPRNGPAMSNVQAIAKICSLQAKLQTLKQAVRIKNSANGDEDEELEQLVSKWTAVGREVAWAVWDTVKDLDPGESMHVGTGSFAAGWGFDEGAGSSRSNPSVTRAWGWEEDVKGPANGSGGGEDQEDSHAVDEAEDETDTAPKHTLGTMLRHLGIAPETLGWDENEGDFVDDH
ncbi:uncharacterized protein LAESUDRAFT_689915 [Laetiporus sulphureus 93-53]|uniref:Uncharacterized protein n=1 Tax=Laetiporus sulphureus 93-53 TaxID=1314785 RepID=A0A165IDF6_9APHY|nr:uncharacterized protein LAESUDRAFT_689915 [Laetiporus sulphureus 93-53]KZT12928.1 hypothetical protein LAESUDRAFT_689915 [Laetiporus sulphureus 93-53]